MTQCEYKEASLFKYRRALVSIRRPAAAPPPRPTSLFRRVPGLPTFSRRLCAKGGNLQLR